MVFRDLLESAVVADVDLRIDVFKLRLLRKIFDFFPFFNVGLGAYIN